jgi:hypothetical protein
MIVIEYKVRRNVAESRAYKSFSRSMITDDDASDLFSVSSLQALERNPMYNDVRHP